MPHISLDDFTKELMTGVINQGLHPHLHSLTQRALQTHDYHPIPELKKIYDLSTDNCLAKLCGIYSPFQHEGKVYQPQEVLDYFFRKAETWYDLALQTIKEEIDPQEFKAEIKPELEAGLKEAIITSHWVVHLASKKLISLIIKGTMKLYGIQEYQTLPQDIEQIGNNFFRLYEHNSI